MKYFSYNYSNSQTDLPRFLRDMLACPPQAGAGVHNWLYRVARQLHHHYSDKAQMICLLEASLCDCGRTVPRREIEAAVNDAAKTAWQPHGTIVATQPAQKKWPDVNQKQREAIVCDNGGLADLWEQSAPRLEDGKQYAEEIIDRLFPSNPLLCCGKSQSVFDTKPRADWRGQLSQLQFIVPSPMTAPTGMTKGGKESTHTLGNTGARRFLICEFDTGTADEHAVILLHLAKYAPLVCAVHSGGKSLHGWFLAAIQPEERVERFFRYAVSLGADRATWTRSQFVRMPDGTRDNGRRQTAYHLNFKPLEASHE